MGGELVRELGLLLRRAQAERLPSVSAAVARGGELVWSEAVGLADVETGGRATPNHQYRVGSITRTFTAVAVMQLRDAGALALDDPLGRHLPEAAKGEPTIGRLLSHLSGLQREPPGQGVLGRWWSEGEETVFSYRGGRLEARAAGDPKDKPPSVFEREGHDRYRTVSGREQGELLEVVRDGAGSVAKLYWATYPCTRDFRSFSDSVP